MGLGDRWLQARDSCEGQCGYLSEVASAELDVQPPARDDELHITDPKPHQVSTSLSNQDDTMVSINPTPSNMQ